MTQHEPQQHPEQPQEQPPEQPTRPDRSSTTRLALFAVGLMLALVGGYGIGRAMGEEAAGAAAPDRSAAAVGTTAADGHNHVHGDAGGGVGGTGGGEVGGMSISASGYTLAPTSTVFPAGVQGTFSFRIIGPNRQPVTQYVVNHEKELHLVIARRDLGGYQHLHPTRAADGTWSVPLTLPTPGSYRAYTDFVINDIAGRQFAAALAVDLTAPGAHTPSALPEPARAATAGPFAVTLEGEPQPGVTRPVSLRVDAPLERYLGAYGHLVVLREGDLAYLHVHPEEQLVDGRVKFWLVAPSAGRYRAYFDFKVAGQVHTAEFTLAVT